MQIASFTRLLLALSIVLLGAACCDSPMQPIGEPAPPFFDPDQAEFTDQELWDAVYSTYKYPPCFYKEDYEGSSPYYVNTVSIKPLDQRERVWIELCTDTYDQAHEWIDLSIENSSVHRTVFEKSQTEKYFEFLARVSWAEATGIRFRIHKCGYLDRSEFDRFNKGPLLGKFNQRPITGTEVRELVEYLHYLGSYNIGGYTVLSSISSEEDSAHVQTIYNTTFVGGDWDLHDRISLYKSDYRVDKESGEITLETELIRRIEGRYNKRV